MFEVQPVSFRSMVQLTSIGTKKDAMKAVIHSSKGSDIVVVAVDFVAQFRNLMYQKFVYMAFCLARLVYN